MRVLWFSVALLFVDQLTKALVVLNMTPGTSIPVIGNWFKLTFTTNPGMAFGLEIAPKLGLTLFSIIATIAIFFYIRAVRNYPLSYRLALAGIMGGAAGNVIDRTFYGVIYQGQPLFYGEVVDFIHFDIWRGVVDLPLMGERFVALFPIWNVADMAIVIGVVAVILLQGSAHRAMEKSEEPETSEETGQDTLSSFEEPVSNPLDDVSRSG